MMQTAELPHPCSVACAFHISWTIMMQLMSQGQSSLQSVIFFFLSYTHTFVTKSTKHFVFYLIIKGLLIKHSEYLNECFSFWLFYKLIFLNIHFKGMVQHFGKFAHCPNPYSHMSRELPFKSKGGKSACQYCFKKILDLAQSRYLPVRNLHVLHFIATRCQCLTIAVSDMTSQMIHGYRFFSFLVPSFFYHFPQFLWGR